MNADLWIVVIAAFAMLTPLCCALLRGVSAAISQEVCAMTNANHYLVDDNNDNAPPEQTHVCIVCGTAFNGDFWRKPTIKRGGYEIDIPPGVNIRICERCYTLFSDSGIAYRYKDETVIPLEMV